MGVHWRPKGGNPLSTGTVTWTYPLPCSIAELEVHITQHGASHQRLGSFCAQLVP